jgi:D-galactarolactone isomerase
LPSYSDVGIIAQEFVKQAPERMLWGTDWPHLGANPLPDDAILFDAFANWIPDEKIRQQILVNNPEKLYDFSD